jgi:chitosanase
MPTTMNVPCNRCDEFRERFENAGFHVLDCEPDPNEPGMCALRFERPGDAVALAPQAMLADPALAAAPAGLTPSQGQTARAIVNIFETGLVLGDYGQVTVLPQDKGRLTYGRSQTSLTSGNLFLLLSRYCANPGAVFGARLRPALPDFQAQAARLDTDRKLHNLLRACADDRVMRETQDAFFDEVYWAPAQRIAKRLGISSALGVAVVYDSQIHGSWGTVRDLTNAAAGSIDQLGERAWVAAYVKQRRAWLAASGNATLRGTVYRMDAFQRLIDQGWWGLPLPLVVRDQEISFASLSATPPGCYDGPQPGTRVIAVSDPLPRGLDVRRAQLGLSDRGVDMVADGIFGQTSSRRVREFQIAHGLPATGVIDLGLMAQLTA